MTFAKQLAKIWPITSAKQVVAASILKVFCEARKLPYNVLLLIKVHSLKLPQKVFGILQRLPVGSWSSFRIQKKCQPPGGKSPVWISLWWVAWLRPWAPPRSHLPALLPPCSQKECALKKGVSGQLQAHTLGFSSEVASLFCWLSSKVQGPISTIVVLLLGFGLPHITPPPPPPPTPAPLPVHLALQFGLSSRSIFSFGTISRMPCPSTYTSPRLPFQLGSPH